MLARSPGCDWPRCHQLATWRLSDHAGLVHRFSCQAHVVSIAGASIADARRPGPRPAVMLENLYDLRAKETTS